MIIYILIQNNHGIYIREKHFRKRKASFLKITAAGLLEFIYHTAYKKINLDSIGVYAKTDGP